MEESQKKELIALIGKRLNRSLKMYMENCARCGICIESCHAYASTGDIRYSPVARAQNIRRLFEKYETITGNVAPWYNEAIELDQKWLDKIYETAYTCTGCRRCMVHCPFGIDTQQIQLLAKEMVIVAGMDPMPLTMKAKAAVAKGENLEQTREKFEKEIAKLRTELKKEWPDKSEEELIPYDVKGANIMFVSMTEKPSILPAANIFTAANESWTLSTFEAVNFGAFLGSPEMAKKIYTRVTDEAEKLGVKYVVICECGTAFRILRHAIGKRNFKVLTLIQLIDRYIKEKRITVDNSVIEGRITYHDPCQIARNGGVYDEPRNVLKTVTDDYVEMTPNKLENWCCGGGGGLVIAAEPEWRILTSRVKADQIKATGATILATACEMCLAQLKDVNDDFELDLDVRLISDIVAEALIKD
jgi:Fe-S oxidoreductase